MDVIKRNTDYALRLMARLAGSESGQAMAARQLAEEEGVSRQLAPKLLQQLGKAGLVHSRMGKRGGFLLSRPASEISLAEMIAAIQGPIRFSQCVAHAQVCPHQDTCRICGRLKQLQECVDQVLEGIALAEMARGAAAGGRSGTGPDPEASRPRSIE